MSTVAEIKAAIPSLTLAERAEVALCLNDWQDDAWDEQMKHDVAGGKLDKLLAKVDKDIAKGRLRDLPFSPKRQDILRAAIKESLEDAAMLRAIQAGEKSRPVSRTKIFQGLARAA